MSNWGVVSLRVLDSLEHIGPMTSSELARELDVHRDSVANVITRLRQPSVRPRGPKRVYIAEWRDEEEGQRTYLRAVYAKGNKRDTEKPSAKSGAERAKRYRDNKRQRNLTLAPFF